MREFGVSYVNAPDPTGQLAAELGVTGIPETHLVDRTGQVVRRWIGPIGQTKAARHNRGGGWTRGNVLRARIFSLQLMNDFVQSGI